jgi:hypothetical protein
MTPESEIAPEARKTGHRWVDLSAAVCALVISLTSLWVAVRHGHTMERMADANARLVSANSYPLLQHYQSNAADLRAPDYTGGMRVASLNVTNSGVGPAKVETLEVSGTIGPCGLRANYCRPAALHRKMQACSHAPVGWEPATCRALCCARER